MKGLFNRAQFNNKTFNVGTIVEAVKSLFGGGDAAAAARLAQQKHIARIHAEDEEAVTAIIAWFTETT